MPGWYWYVLIGLIVGPLLLKWVILLVVVPIRVGRRQRVARMPLIEQAGPGDFTQELVEMLRQVVPQFAAEGFELAAHLVHRAAVSDVRSMEVLLVDRRTGDVGLVIAVWGTGTRSILPAVRSAFSDGTSIVTAANPAIGTHPSDPTSDVANFAWAVGDIRALCEAHRRRLARAGKAHLPRVAPAAGAEVAHAQAEWTREIDRMRRLGYQRLAADADHVRYTVKGMFLCTWKLIEPIKGWRIRRRDAKARQLWRELGMETFAAPPVGYPGAAAAMPVAPPAVMAPVASGAPAVSAVPPVAFQPVAPTGGGYGTAVPPDHGGLGYARALAPDEIRIEAGPGGTTVLMGHPTLGKYLASRWPTFLSIAIWGVFGGFYAYTVWRIWAFRARWGGPPVGGWPNGVALIFFVICFCGDVFKLLWGALALRGVTMLTATPTGLTYHHTRAVRGHSGQIARAAVEALIVAAHTVGLRGRTYRLLVKEHGQAPRALLTGRDRAALDAARAALAVVLGIESPAPQVAEVAV